MSLDGSVLLVLALVCLFIAVLQAIEWPKPLQLTAVLLLGAALIASGGLASHTSTAAILQWSAVAQRRQDLATLLLAEVLLFGTLAVRLTQGLTPRWLAWLPLPSALMALFFAQVAVMLMVDGWDYETLACLFALGSTALLIAGTLLLRWCLPERTTRGALRVGLHGAEALAGLWLARPALQSTIAPTPLWGQRLAILATAVVGLATLGWLMQRRRHRINQESKPWSR